jgi:DNA-binding GntR family transcriptional regulator
MTPRRAGTAPPSPTEDVYERLRELIVTGRVAPGTRLVETEFARRLLVSRTPVREAMRRLTQEGLANVVASGRRTQIAVAPVTRSDMSDLFAIIGALEGIAGRGAATLSKVSRRDLATGLSELNSRFEALSRAVPRDFQRFFEAHDAFHSLFVERCASERLRLLIDAVRPQVKRYELIYANVVGHDFDESLREHRTIISAFRSGSADAIDDAIRRNWFNSAARLAGGPGSASMHGLGDYRVAERKA